MSREHQSVTGIVSAAIFAVFMTRAINLGLGTATPAHAQDVAVEQELEESA